MSITHARQPVSSDGGGTVVEVDTSTGLIGGPITDTGTIALADTAVTPGAYTNANVTIDQQGRITAAADGDAGTVTSVMAGTGLSGGTITSSGTIALANTAVTAGAYTNANVTIDAQGRVTAAANGDAGTVTSVIAGTGLSGGTITGSGTIALANTAVTAGAYTNANVTIDAQGRITAAADGTAGTVTSIVAGTGLTGGTITGSGTVALDVPVTVAHGGTGNTIFDTHSVLLGQGTSEVTNVSPSHNPYYTLHDSNGLGGDPAWSLVDLGTDITGTLSVDYGGIGMDASSAANGTLLIGNSVGFSLALLTPGTGIAITNTSGNITIALDGTVAVAGGGTGIDGSSAANGTLLIGNGSGYSLHTLTAGTGISITNGSGTITINSTGVTSLSGSTTGLTPNTATTGAITLGGTLNPGHGGTGITTYSAGDMLYYDGFNLQKLAVGGANTLIHGGSVPGYSAVDLAADVTGTLDVANGGTGAASLTANNVLLGNGTSALQVVAPGTSGNVLTSNGTTWTSAAPAGGGGLTTFSVTTTDAVNTTSLVNLLSISVPGGSLNDGETICFWFISDTKQNHATSPTLTLSASFGGTSANASALSISSSGTETQTLRTIFCTRVGTSLYVAGLGGNLGTALFASASSVFVTAPSYTGSNGVILNSLNFATTNTLTINVTWSIADTVVFYKIISAHAFKV